MKVEFNCEDWKNLTRQIDEQTKVCCKNCVYNKFRYRKSVQSICVRCFSFEDFETFVQKPLTLLVAESVFEKPSMERVPIKLEVGDIIEFVCGDCKNKKLVDCRDNEGCREDCFTCKGIDSYKVEVKSITLFEKKGGVVYNTYLSESVGDRAEGLEDCNYVMVEVKLC